MPTRVATYMGRRSPVARPQRYRPRPRRRGRAHSRPARKGQCLPPSGPQRGDANIGTAPAREVSLEGSDNYRRGCRQQHATLPLTKGRRWWRSKESGNKG
ncbi:hypothetical protein BHE74_00046894 [Ensete ventricosum]|nr:hypothetical protein BHE74_00046894 [Ensete ventricosum]